MLNLVLNAMGLVLGAAIATHSVILHVRLGRLRQALAEMGDILPAFDASVGQISAIADGFTNKLTRELQGIEGLVKGARRLHTDLAAGTKTAEEATQLERLLRQLKRLDMAHASRGADALPRELVEPKGFAERAGLAPAQKAPARNTAQPLTAGEPNRELADAILASADGGLV